ncbi:hypothetical protein UlMin_036628 [Ulmus minor]
MDSSITEEQLIQMVRDFIESESASSSDPLPQTNHQPSHIDTLQAICSLIFSLSFSFSIFFLEIVWRVMDSEVEILEKILMYLRDIGNVREPNSLKKWVVLRLKMDGYEASLCKTSWVCFRGLARGFYEFVDVMVRDKNDGDKPTKRVIVDLDFRSEFELARPTKSYKELINALPSIFVGTEEKLGNVISLLCKAAKQSLKESGLHIPPWRKASYMLAKWLSDNCKRI